MSRFSQLEEQLYGVEILEEVYLILLSRIIMEAAYKSLSRKALLPVVSWRTTSTLNARMANS